MASSHVRFFSILKKRGVSMVFHSKIDNTYRAILGCVCVIMALSFLLPMTLDDSFTKQDCILLGSILLLTTLFIVWVMVDIRYELREDELYVRGGPIFARIPYTTIREVRKFDGFTGGFTIASSKKGIEIIYQKGLGYMVISPTEREHFIVALEAKITKARAH